MSTDPTTEQQQELAAIRADLDDLRTQIDQLHQALPSLTTIDTTTQALRQTLAAITAAYDAATPHDTKANPS